MNRTIMQLIALTSYGNEYLSTGNLPEDFYPGHPAFQYCGQVNFVLFRKRFFGKLKEIIVAPDPLEWLRLLKHYDCRKLRLFFQPSGDSPFAEDHTLAGFVDGGGTWLVECVYDEQSAYWANRWTVTSPEAKDSKTWKVNYVLTAKDKKTSNIQPDPGAARAQLGTALTAIADFAYQHNLLHWGDTFAKAEAILHHPSPGTEHDPGGMFVLKNYSLEAQQLLLSAGSAWVFGDMGPWNDLVFDDQQVQDTYTALSAQLYYQVNEAILAGLNSY